MSRLIDADALLNDIDAVPLTWDGGVDINDLEEIIKRQPTAEPIIRCKDCDNFDPDDYDCFTFGCKMRPDGFCSFATERGGQ